MPRVADSSAAGADKDLKYWKKYHNSALATFVEKKTELDNKIEELKSLQKQWREANASRAPPSRAFGRRRRFAVSGITAADANTVAAQEVFQDAIARVAGVDKDQVRILSVSAAARRRLTDSVTVEFDCLRYPAGAVVRRELKFSTP